MKYLTVVRIRTFILLFCVFFFPPEGSLNIELSLWTFVVKIETVLWLMLPGGRDTHHPDYSADTDADHLAAPLRGLNSLEMLSRFVSLTNPDWTL